MSEKMDMSVKFGGRTIFVEIAINTDEPLEEVLERIAAYAPGPKLRASVLFNAREVKPGDKEGLSFVFQLFGNCQSIADNPNHPKRKFKIKIPS